MLSPIRHSKNVFPFSREFYKGFLNEPTCELEESIGQLLGLQAARREKGHPGRGGGSPAPVSAPAGQVALRSPSRVSHRATIPQGESEGPRRPQPRAHEGHVPGDSRPTLWFAHTGPSTHVTSGSQSRRGPPPDHRDDGDPGLDQPRSATRRRRQVPLQRSQLGAAAIFLEERARGEGSPTAVAPHSYLHLPSPDRLSSSAVT